MRNKALWLLFIAALAGTAAAAPAGSPAPVRSDGLVEVRSQTLDEFYVRPNADLAGYRRILIDAPRAELTKGWLKNMNATRDVSRWLAPDDARRITDEAASSMRIAVAQAFAARGYEAVTEPGPGVLRLSPAVTELFVNAPDVPAPGVQIGIVHDAAGSATLRLEVRDAVTGTLVGQVIDRDTAREVRRFDRATSVSNLFWFEAMFSQWASNCAREFEAVKALP